MVRQGIGRAQSINKKGNETMKLGSELTATYIRLSIELGDGVAPVEIATRSGSYGEHQFYLVEPDDTARAELPEAMALPIAQSAVKELARWIRKEAEGEGWQ